MLCHEDSRALQTGTRVGAGGLNWTRHSGLSLLRFLAMHAVMRFTFGISLLQRTSASRSHARRCSAVAASTDDVPEKIRTIRFAAPSPIIVLMRSAITNSNSA